MNTGACGIYCIENTVNGKKYIGKASTSFEQRWYLHKWHLNKGTHGNRHLQRAWNKYGKDSFLFYIVEELPAIDKILNEAEIYYISKFQSHEIFGGYNLTLGGDGSSGWIPSEETKKKIAKANTGFVKSDEAKKRLSLALRGKKRQPLSSEHKEKLRIASTGKKHSGEAKEKMSKSHKGLFSGIKHPLFGKRKSDESKRKLSKSVHREKHPRFGKKSNGSSSKYYGVIFDKRYNGSWVAKFTLDGKKVYIGSCKLEVDAAKMYDEYIVSHNLSNPLNFSDVYERNV